MSGRIALVAACVMAAVVETPNVFLATPLGAVSQDVGRRAPDIVWSVPGSPRGTPVADSAIVYFLTTTHEVVALDAATGRRRWTATTGEKGQKTHGSSLVRSGSFVVAGDDNVVAFDAATGEVRWRFVPVLGYGPGLFLGAATRERVYAGSPAGRVYAIDTSSGDLRWSTAVAAGAATTVFEPVVDAEIVAASYTVFTSPPTGGVIALDASTGQIRWRTSFPASDVPLQSTGAGGGPVVAGDVVLATSGTGRIHAFDRDTGLIRWFLHADEQTLMPPADPARPDFRALTRRDAVLVAGSLTGRITAYDLRRRARLWRTPADLFGSTGFRLSSDDLLAYVPHVGGSLRALRLDDGRERWRLGEGGEQFLWPPLPAGDRLYVGSTKGFNCILR